MKTEVYTNSIITLADINYKTLFLSVILIINHALLSVMIKSLHSVTAKICMTTWIMACL